MIAQAQVSGVQRWSMLLQEHGALPMFMARFDHAQFDPALFACESMFMPTQIANSVRKRQAEFFHGRLCARAALQHYGCAQTDVAIGLSREPIWPAGTIGSISHNHTLAAATVLPQGPYTGAGIDVETVMNGDAWKGMIDIVLSDAEIDYMRTLAHAAPFGVLTTLVFSAKESFYKAMFGTVKRFLDFNTIALTHVDMVRRSLSFRIADPECAALQGSERCSIAYRVLDETTVCTAFIW